MPNNAKRQPLSREEQYQRRLVSLLAEFVAAADPPDDRAAEMASLEQRMEVRGLINPAWTNVDRSSPQTFAQTTIGAQQAMAVWELMHREFPMDSELTAESLANL